MEPEPEQEREPEPRTRRAYMEHLMAMKPQRENFLSEGEFEEAYGYFMSHQGRVIAIIQAQLKRSHDD